MPARKMELGDLATAESQGASLVISSTDLTDKMSDTQTKPETSNDSILKSPVVTITVGPNKTRYLIHEQALIQAKAGPFFNKTFTNGFLETYTKSLDLPEDDPDAFRVFAEWLYGTCLLGDLKVLKIIFSDDDATRLLEYYIFADKYQIDDLQDIITSELYFRAQHIHWHDAGFNRDSLVEFWAKVFPIAHPHRLLARWFINDSLYPDRGDKPEGIAIDGIVKDLPDEFVRLVMREMFKLQSADAGSDLFLGPMSEYLLIRGRH